MNFIPIIKILSIFIFLISLISCSVESISNKLKIKENQISIPIIDNYDDQNISLDLSIIGEINYKNKIILSDFKNTNQYLNNIVIVDNFIFVLNENNQIQKFNSKTGKLISSEIIEVKKIEDDTIVSLNYINNSFIIALKSGSIMRINMFGQVMWEYEGKKTLNTQLKIINEQIILLYVDEIKSILLDNGTEVWSEVDKDLPVYQAKGGQLVNFLNFLFYILPNNKTGLIDHNLGSVQNFTFNEISLISSINNTKDKIHVYDNFFVYLDEGEYLYTFDIFKNDFVIFKKNINLSTSNILFQNSLIIKQDNFLQAINILNGKTFWLVKEDSISRNSIILAIRNYGSNIEIFLSNGDVLTINNKQLIKKINLNVGDIKKVSFSMQNIIVHTKNKKTLILK